jgi:DNA polymerase-3 subunit gamma/tau
LEASARAIGQFAVDDEPEEAASAPQRTATLAPPRDGEVVADVQPVAEESDEADVPVVPAPEPPRATATLRTNHGVQRYGEAVVRQVLGATFLREEPYESPTRFQ